MAGDGQEFTFRPSLGRIAALGSPHEIVELYAGLHGPRAAHDATCVLAALCDQDDPTPLIGRYIKVESGPPRAKFRLEQLPPTGDRYEPGEMPQSEQIIIARHLMQHGIVGKAKPGKGGGQYSDRFDAAEYIAEATVHLGLSDADAQALSMTDFQIRFAMKFPAPETNELTIEDFEAALAAEQERELRGRGHA